MSYSKSNVEDRFWNKVKKTTSCWIWIGCILKKGKHGQFRTDKGLRILAHRYSYIIHKGPIPDLMCVLHTCDNPPCINPDHLFLGDRIINNKDRRKKNRDAFGERHGLSKLKDSQVIEIRKQYLQGIKPKQLALHYKIAVRTMYYILNNKTWRHLLTGDEIDRIIK